MLKKTITNIQDQSIQSQDSYDDILRSGLKEEEKENEDHHESILHLDEFKSDKRILLVDDEPFNLTSLLILIELACKEL